MKRLLFLLLVVPLVLGAAAQQPPSPEPRAPSPDAKDEGIPVTSDLVKQKCSSCHKVDDKGRLTRISFRRTTPEGWEETIKRMVSLNNVKIEPSEAREVLRYLADRHGLAPEWSAWAATMRPPRLHGTWALAGYQLGKGPVFGRVIVDAQGGPDSGEFTTQATYTIPRTGERITRTGRAIVYTGYQWRGRS